MKAVLLDDEPFALQFLERLCLQVPGLEVAASFSDSSEALSYLSEHKADLVITDIEMPGLSGMEAAACLRELQPGLGIIFVTGYEQYALQAFKLEAAAYLLKPCGLEELCAAVKRAGLLALPQTAVVIRTFGYFSVTISGVPVRFANSKAKELLALLVDRRGSVVTMEQAVDVLWEDRPYDDMVKRLYRKAVSHLHQLFSGTGFFASARGSCHIVPDAAECDYFSLLQDPTGFSGLYSGEYLMDYGWAEPTNGKILRILEKN